jgi:uncharacterized protein (TIGR01777 family)
MKNKKIVIAGGSGFIGQALIAYFSKNNNVIVLSRNIGEVNNSYNQNKLTNTITTVHWDGKTLGNWCKVIDGSDVIINLCGKSVNCRYTTANKRAIFDSRILPTKAIGEAINLCKNPPTLWLNAASATIYRHATDKPQDEFVGNIQNDFSVQVCKKWEASFFEQETPFTRKVVLRTAITLGNGGVMIPYFNLLKFGLGGKQGSGKQMYSWVHIDDVCAIIDYVYHHTNVEGVVNVSSPNPVTNNIFMQVLRQQTNTNIGLPAFTWMLKIGAAIIGTEKELLLKSRWVLPTKLLNDGYQFKYPHLEQAVKAIVKNVPKKQYALL